MRYLVVNVLCDFVSRYIIRFIASFSLQFPYHDLASVVIYM